MKVLMVSKYNPDSPTGFSPFVYEQALALINQEIEVEHFAITGKGTKAYIKSILRLNKFLKKNYFDIIHGHYGLSGIVAVLQNKVPAVVSLIGCDINVYRNRLLARIFLFRKVKAIIFVSEKLQVLSKFSGYFKIIPYGVDLKKFYPVEKKKSLQKLDLPDDSLNVFFASRFDRIEKNASLAFEAIKILNDQNFRCNLIEFKDIGPQYINDYYNASNLFLITSIREGSPQSLKEAMACNCPIVATDVGDIKWVIGDTEGCYLTSFDPCDVAEKIKLALDFREKKVRTTGRERIIELGLDSESIAKRIIEVYKEVLNKNK
jgi:glycosyltransferase involved in cell wall biosynthesis